MKNTASAPLLLEIPRHLNDKRVDSALKLLLQEKCPEQTPLSRAFLTRALKEGKILVNGAVVLPRALVVTHDILSVSPGIFLKNDSVEPSFEPVDLTKIFENERILVVDKGPGVQMHQGGSHQGTTVAQWVLAHYPELSTVGEDPLRPGIVHRLDRDTSGILVIAKDGESFQALKKSFQDRDVEKNYVALVYGHLSEREGKVDASLIRNPGELRRRAIDSTNYTGTLPGNTRTALTYYRVIERYQDYDLVLLTPKTGRTHQIRVHMAFLGHPVVGDRLYAFKEVKRKNLLFPKRHLLHSTKLSFTLFDEQYQFESPLPEDFKQVLANLDPLPSWEETDDSQ
ncbi:MAG: RluA family pseudouridine synthase [Candidatus Moraniibacteriota bacterium]